MFVILYPNLLSVFFYHSIILYNTVLYFRIVLRNKKKKKKKNKTFKNRYRRLPAKYLIFERMQTFREIPLFENTFSKENEVARQAPLHAEKAIKPSTEPHSIECHNKILGVYFNSDVYSTPRCSPLSILRRY